MDRRGNKPCRTWRAQLQCFASLEFASLWERIRYRGRYRVNLESGSLPALVAASEMLDELDYLGARATTVESADLTYDDAGRVATADRDVAESSGERLVAAGEVLPDLLRLIYDHLMTGKYPLQLTRRTLAAVALNPAPPPPACGGDGCRSDSPIDRPEFDLCGPALNP